MNDIEIKPEQHPLNLQSMWVSGNQGRTQVEVKTPHLELDILQKLYYLRKGDKGDKVFSHTFACSFVDLMQTPRNELACKCQGAF